MASKDSSKDLARSQDSGSSIVNSESAAVLTGTFLAGNMMNISVLSIPMLLDTATTAPLLVNQWATVYDYGHRMAPPMAIVTALIYGKSIYKRRAKGEPWRVFAVATALTLTMVPFTLVFINPTNNRLFRANDLFKAGKAAIGMDEAQSLVKFWNKLHIVRTMFPLAGALLGFLGIRGGVVF